MDLKGITNIKNSEISIGDRYSVGSSITNQRILDIFEIKEMENKDDKIEVLEMPTEVQEKKEVSLAEIDEEILTIDDFLDDFKIE